MSPVVERWCGVHGRVWVALGLSLCPQCQNPLVNVDPLPKEPEGDEYEWGTEVYRIGWADNDSLRHELVQAYGLQIAFMATLATATAIFAFTGGTLDYIIGAVVVGLLVWGVIDSWRRRRVHKEALNG